MIIWPQHGQQWWQLCWANATESTSSTVITSIINLEKGGVHMEVKATFKPGENGTKRLLQQYGDQLVCVRYRYDRAKQRRYKTVELIVE